MMFKNKWFLTKMEKGCFVSMIARQQDHSSGYAAFLVLPFLSLVPKKSYIDYCDFSFLRVGKLFILEKWQR